MKVRCELGGLCVPYDTVPAVLDLVTAGEAFDDVVFHGLAALPRLGEEIRTDRLLRSPGGGAVITAIAASRLGLQCAALGGFSGEAARVLRDEGVRVRNLRRQGEAAPMTVAISTPRDRAFVTFTGMNDRLPGRLRRGLARVRARHVHLAFCPALMPSVADDRRIAAAQRDRHLLGLRVESGNTRRPAVRRARHVSGLSFRESRRSTRLFWRAIVDRGARAMACRAQTGRRQTRRRRRARRRIRRQHRERAVTVRVVDTTGAGDAFNAGFLAGRLRGLELRDALQLANRVGALSTRRAGGLAALPRIRFADS
jgi:sugar/nucleoside kinase (ribokinase family)